MADIQTLHEDLQDLIKAVQGGNKNGAAQQGGSQGGSLGDAFGRMGQRFMGNKGMAGKMPTNAPGMSGGTAAGMGKIMGPVVALGVEMAKLPQKVKEFTEGLHRANREFQGFSPGMAQVMAMSDLGDMMRAMQKGEALAPSAGNLADARGRLLDATAPAETAWQRLKNGIGSVAANATAAVLEKSEWGKQLANGVNDLAELTEKMNEAVEDGNRLAAADDPWMKELNAVVEEQKKLVEERRRPIVAPVPKPWAEHRGGGDF